MKAYKLAVNSLDSIQTFNAAASGSFPNWRAVVPQGQPQAEISVNAEYLEKLCAYVREYGDERCAPIRLTIYGKDSAMRFDARTADGQAVMGLLMPLRSDSVTFAKRPHEVVEETKAEENNSAEVEKVAA